MKKNKRGEHFNIALIVIFISIAVSLISFMSADNSNQATGFAVSDLGNSAAHTQQPELLQFSAVSSLSRLSSGSYYIDADGVVYWLDDISRPAIGKVIHLSDSQKNREMYIDKDGNVGYLIR